MSGQRFILLIDAQAWRLVLFKCDQYCELRSFGPDEAGLAAMLGWLQTFPGARVAVLTDLPEEHYHLELMPVVRGAAGRALLKRKLAAWPHAQGLHTAFLLETIKTSRLENRFLFAGLFSPPLIHCLHALQAAALSLQGIYTQAILLPYCLPANAQRLSDCICVHAEHTTLCLSYFKHQRLCLRRRLSMPTQEMQDVASVIPALTQLHRELVSQFDLSESASLPVFCIIAEIQQAERLTLPAPFQYQPLTEAALIAAVGQGSLPTGLRAVEWVAMHAILADQALPNLAPEASLLPEKLKRLQRNIHVAGVGLALLLALLAGFHALSTQQLNTQAGLVKAQLDEPEAMPFAGGLRAEQLPAIHALTRTMQAISASTRLPDQALHDLQPMLTGLRDWQLIRLEWQAERPESADPDAHQTQSLKMTFQQRETSQHARAVLEWQQLMQRLNQLPSVKQLQTETSSQQSTTNGRQGSTDPLAMLGLQPMLTLTWAAVQQEGW